MSNKLLHTAIIIHRHGTNVYHAKSETGLYIQLYNYVKEYWSEVFEEDETPIPTNEIEAIDMYFEDNGRESYEVFHPEEIESIPE